MKTLQEAFDTAVTGMLKQGRRSVSAYDPSSCRYRGCGGLKCGVGFLIADEYYSESIERQAVCDNEVLSAVADSGYPADKEALELYEEIQDIHDGDLPADWAVELESLAVRSGLIMPEVTINEDWRKAMTDQRTLVSNEFTRIDPNEPMNRTNLWLWLNQWTVSSIPHRNIAEIVIAYLAEACGYDHTRNVISSEDSASLRMVIDHWFSTNPWFGDHRASDLLQRRVTEGRQTFTVKEATPLLIGLVRQSHWIYADRIDESNTYFVVEHGKIYAVAQQILARRFLCRLSGVGL